MLLITALRALVSADVNRDAAARTELWLALVSHGYDRRELGRVYGEHVARVERRQLAAGRRELRAALAANDVAFSDSVAA